MRREQRKTPRSPKTISIPQAGQEYFGLSRNGSYDAARRGDIPTISVGRLRRVPVVLMERLLESAGQPRRAKQRRPPA